MKTITDVFASLPAKEQKAILEQVEVALLWRGWDRTLVGVHAVVAIVEIGKIFYRNGHEYPEYT